MNRNSSLVPPEHRVCTEFAPRLHLVGEEGDIRQTSKHNMKLSCSIGSCLPNELRYSNRSEMCRRLFLQCSETLSENVYLIVTDHSAMFDEINMMQNG